MKYKDSLGRRVRGNFLTNIYIKKKKKKKKKKNCLIHGILCICLLQCIHNFTHPPLPFLSSSPPLLPSSSFDLMSGNAKNPNPRVEYPPIRRHYYPSWYPSMTSLLPPVISLYDVTITPRDIPLWRHYYPPWYPFMTSLLPPVISLYDVTITPRDIPLWRHYYPSWYSSMTSLLPLVIFLYDVTITPRDNPLWRHYYPSWYSSMTSLLPLVI